MKNRLARRMLSVVAASSLVLSMSAAASATTVDQDTADKSGATAVSLDVDPAYTVTIPATVELNAQGTDPETYGSNMDITASAGVRLDEGQKIIVTMKSDSYDSGSFYISADDADQYKLAYTVTVDNTTITNGGTVATFGTSDSAQASTLHFSAGDPTYAGEYSDTVTFTIAVQ